jgi:hypothetical protein
VPCQFLSLYAGAVGFMLNLATLWCVSNTTATTYAVIGALNKIPLAFIGYVTSDVIAICVIVSIIVLVVTITLMVIIVLLLLIIIIIIILFLLPSPSRD